MALAYGTSVRVRSVPRCSSSFDSTENGLPVRDAVQKQIARNKVKRAKLESNDVVGQAMHDLCLAGHELQRLGREGTIHGIAAVLARELEPRRQIPTGDRRIYVTPLSPSGLA